MQNNPEQPPEGEVQPTSQPLYEFSPEEQAAPENIASSTPDTTSEQVSPPYTEEDIRQGRIYPPPPSYYQNMRQAPIQPEPPGAIPPTHASVPPPAVPFYGPFPPPMQKKKSYKWVWILVSGLVVLVLGACGLCSWAAYSLYTQTSQPIAQSLNIVNNYYQAIQERHYQEAYNYLGLQDTSSRLTLDAFTRQAQDQDNRYGPVLSFVPGTPSYSIGSNNAPDLTHLTYTIDVKRQKLQYPALLKVERIQGQWKITYFDRV